MGTQVALERHADLRQSLDDTQKAGHRPGGRAPQVPVEALQRPATELVCWEHRPLVQL